MKEGSETELERARAALERLLDADSPEASVYRAQLEFVTLRRQPTGCSIEVDRNLVPPAAFDARMPGARLPVDAGGHGKLRILLHGWQGYLDDLELINARVFPEPSTLKIRNG